MRILELEQKYSELKSDLCGQHSKRTKLLKISGYFSFALSFPNTNLIEPYVIDLIPDFLRYSGELEIRGLDPIQIQLLNDQVNYIEKLNFNGIELNEYEIVRLSLENKIQLMNNWLNSNHSHRLLPKIYFPLIEKNDDYLGSGYLESVNIIIKAGEQKFHISPSDIENDDQLDKQIRLCFEKAIEYCTRHIKKIEKSHTVYLHFENRLGILTGNSLGAALTLAFIEAILKFYNSPIVVNIKNSVAITGGISKDSNILSTSKTIIEPKVETVFYSDVEVMCVPKIDEMWAVEKLKHLNEKHPNRKLKIIGIADLDDLLDRRQVADIRKQKLVVRSGKFVKKNWISAVTTVLLAILFAYLFVMDFDDNPAAFTLDGKYVLIKNKNGKELWKKYFYVSEEATKDIRLAKNLIKIIDSDDDGLNEVILTTQFNEELIGKPDLICYDRFGQKKWTYVFRDIIHCERENIQPEYGISIIDTLKYKNNTVLFVIANNIPSFPSAIITIELKTGRRLPGAFWGSGATVEGLLIDIDNDKLKEFIGFGWDNSYEDVVLYSKEIDTLTEVRKATDSYLIKDYPLAKLSAYVRIPKTDYENYFGKHRTPSMVGGSFCYLPHKKLINFMLHQDVNNRFNSYGLSFDHKLNVSNAIIGNDFRIARDTLVAHQKLNPPYTDTEEYKNIIMDNILYWKDGKWVNRKGIEKK